MQTIAIIVAAGEGRRYGSTLPKQYLPYLQKPLLRYSLETFLSHSAIDAIQVVIHPHHLTYYQAATDQLPLLPPVYGGSERSLSVCQGLQAIAPYAPRYVLIHDAARPFVSSALITEIYQALQHAPAVIPICSVKDTTIVGREGCLHTVLPRTDLYTVQTPQGFWYDRLYACYNPFPTQPMTDEGSLAHHCGIPVTLIPGEYQNQKITYPQDFPVSCITKVGIGYDIHRFEPHPFPTTIQLGGIAIPSNHRIIAHSDGDVLLHALVDALLGAIGAGDIGEYFPPTDIKWKNADSTFFLTEAYRTVQEVGGRIAHIDTTVMCETPKITPYKKAIRESIASLLALSPSQVNVKATTHEGLGALGRKEGIAVQAVVTLSCPPS